MKGDVTPWGFSTIVLSIMFAAFVAWPIVAVWCLALWLAS